MAIKHLAAMMWGFLPNGVKNLEAAERFWNGYKDEKGKWNTGFITLNAMGEELFEKRLYQDAALNRRCIVFVDGFYEWHHFFPIGRKGQRLKTPTKYPHHIFLKDNPLPFFMMAGIWNLWKHEEVNNETGEIETIITPTFAVVTTKANALMANTIACIAQTFVAIFAIAATAAATHIILCSVGENRKLFGYTITVHKLAIK